MAKDPAFLFYTSDFLTGTLTMTDEQVGRYIRLLCLQHQKFELTEKDMLFICKTYDHDIFSKFVKTEDGKFYNVRLREEAIKRSNYSESRRLNKLNKHKKNISSTYVEHMENENENENEDINKDKNNKGKPKKPKFISPTIDEVVKFFEEHGYTNGDKAWNYYNDGDWKDSKGNPVVSWKQKMRMVWFKDENKKQPTEHEKLAQANRERWQRERERFEQLHK
jgi:hypothetical protein